MTETNFGIFLLKIKKVSERGQPSLARQNIKKSWEKD